MMRICGTLYSESSVNRTKIIWTHGLPDASCPLVGGGLHGEIYIISESKYVNACKLLRPTKSSQNIVAGKGGGRDI